ncbi:MAG: Flp pilus assembly protein TadD, partial [Myxococcota bacterium]
APSSLGLAYLDTNQLSLARFVFQKALAAVEGAEDNAYLNCNLGRVYQLEGSPALARAFLTKARTLDGDLLAAQVFLAEIYMADHNYGGVVELLERAVEIDPTNTGVVLTLGVAYRGVGRFEDAEAAYRRASELDPADPSPWFNLGILFGDHTKDYEASLASFQRYLDSGGREAERARDYVKDVERERSRAEKRRNAEEERKKREAERAERQRLLEQAEREKAAAEAAAPPAPVPVEDPASVEEGAEGSDDQTPPGEDNGPWDSNDPKE